MRIEIEHGHELARGVINGHHDLRSRRGVAGDVTRKRVNVGHELRAPLARRRSADAAIERDLQASERSLIRTDAHQTRRNHAIKTGPTGIWQLFMENAGGG